MEAFEELEAGDPRQVGRYRIVARLGAGGMGRVYLGRSPGGRAVAVKVVRPELADDGDFRRRFAREVAAARRVNGVFTAGVVDADPDGSPAWLATAYVPGVPLGDAVAAHGPWPEGPVLALGAGLAEALEAIHAAEVVHRDLKPSNILLAPDGPRVIDFGISVTGEASALTRTGVVVGTPGFMSPEQLTGKPVGPASDVFSLGAVLAFTATGAGPFGTGSAHALSFRVVYEEPDLRRLPPDVRDLVAECLAKEPGGRPTVPTLLDRLARAAGGVPAVNSAPSQAGWLPEPVAAAVRTRTATQPSPEPSARVVPPRPGEWPDGDRPPSVDAAGGPAGPSRRRALLGVGAGVAGLGFGGWSIYDNRSSATRRREAGPGEQRWRFQVGGLVYASPAVADGLVYISSSRNLCAVDASTGEQRWKRPRTGVGYSSPVAVRGTVLLSSVDENLYALDGATGKEQWKFHLGSVGSQSPTEVGGIVYAGGENGNLHAVDIADGSEKWHFFAGGGVSSSPAVAEAVVYFGSFHSLFAVDAATGEQRWKATADASVFTRPAVVDGVVYAGSEGGTLLAVDAVTGEQRWKTAVGGVVSSSLTVSDGVVYAGSADGNLYAVEAATGKRRWKFPIGKRTLSSPTVSDGVVYVGGGDRHLYAVNGPTGKQRWKFATGGAVYSTPAVSDGVVYVGSEDGYLHAVTR
ncbi:outer membrane protein assembly factor BamB family protein [Streptomyces mirabilis]|uniref:outer membrane protein assembly factor BamB family protein n=1 Tax=Streptomyces mirabilis TaxID=68239 RepID=UPI0036809BF6